MEDRQVKYAITGVWLSIYCIFNYQALDWKSNYV